MQAQFIGFSISFDMKAINFDAKFFNLVCTKFNSSTLSVVKTFDARSVYTIRSYKFDWSNMFVLPASSTVYGSTQIYAIYSSSNVVSAHDERDFHSFGILWAQFYGHFFRLPPRYWSEWEYDKNIISRLTFGHILATILRMAPWSFPPIRVSFRFGTFDIDFYMHIKTHKVPPLTRSCCYISVCCVCVCMRTDNNNINF